jgi:predicted ATP-grasp superfamily ATP-dependent carboligase
MILFMLALDKRGRSRRVRGYSVHPGGVVGTRLLRMLTRKQVFAAGLIDEQGNPIIDPENGLKTPEQGAATILWCATSPLLSNIGGIYCQDSDIAPLVRAGDQAGALGQDISARALGLMPHAADPEAAERIIELSERMTGVQFPA